MRVYRPYDQETELERLFNEKKPFASHNGPRSFAALLFKREPEDATGSRTFEDADGNMTYEHCSNTGLFQMDDGQLYDHLCKHELTKKGKDRFAVRNAFKSDFKKNPGWFDMHCWMIEWCSKKLTTGNGFLELGNATTGMDIDVEADYPLSVVKLDQFGLVPLRRSGHPEYEYSDGIYYDSSEIQKRRSTKEFHCRPRP